jgi:hypothetical protein
MRIERDNLIVFAVAATVILFGIAEFFAWQEIMRVVYFPR